MGYRGSTKIDTIDGIEYLKEIPHTKDWASTIGDYCKCNLNEL